MESRFHIFTLSGNVVSMNTYNVLGQRVEDVTQSSTTEEAYGADGALLARYTGDSNSRSFVPFKGRLLAEYYCGGVIFDHPDEIGSATTATDCTGKNVQERLYYPFGEFWNGAGSLGMHQEFAQLPDYDPETDQYNTPNRHYTPVGRWLSPDPLGGDLTNPQSLNRYAHALNNPTTLTDPLGLLFTSQYSCINAWSMCLGAASPWMGGAAAILDLAFTPTETAGSADSQVLRVCGFCHRIIPFLLICAHERGPRKRRRVPTPGTLRYEDWCPVAIAERAMASRVSRSSR
jgi:RHS repeat-associated protein